MPVEHYQFKYVATLMLINVCSIAASILSGSCRVRRNANSRSEPTSELENLILSITNRENTQDFITTKRSPLDCTATTYLHP